MVKLLINISHAISLNKNGSTDHRATSVYNFKIKTSFCEVILFG